MLRCMKSASNLKSLGKEIGQEKDHKLCAHTGMCQPKFRKELFFLLKREFSPNFYKEVIFINFLDFFQNLVMVLFDWKDYLLQQKLISPLAKKYIYSFIKIF